MLKKKAKELLKSLLILGCGYGGLYICFRAPAIHDQYLRYTVGSQVVLLVNEDEQSGGTGFYVKAESGANYILTNAHVCGHEGQTIVNTLNEETKRLVKLRIIEVSNSTDLCLVEAPKYITNGLSLASGISKGDEVIVVGHPHLLPLTVSHGQMIGYGPVKVLAGQGACPQEGGMFSTAQTFFGDVCVMSLQAGFTNALILPGNSGSPIVSFSGKLIGVVFAAGDDGWACIIPLDQVKEFLSAY